MLKGNLTCTIVNKLLTYFVEDTLDNKCKEMISIHLRNCPKCMEHYSVVKRLFNEAEKRRKLIRERERMYEEISAYLDGEMNPAKIQEFEKKLSTDPYWEESLIETLKLKRMLNNSFYKTKYNIKSELYKKVTEKLKKNSGILKKVIGCIKKGISKAKINISPQPEHPPVEAP